MNYLTIKCQGGVIKIKHDDEGNDANAMRSLVDVMKKIMNKYPKTVKWLKEAGIEFEEVAQ